MANRIDVSTAKLDNLIIHRVGNKSRDEGLRLSERPAETNQRLEELLLRHYLLPLVRDAEEFEFHHEADITLNAVLKFSHSALDQTRAFVTQSQSIAKHLYGVSVHPAVLAGELMIMAFSGVFLDGQPCKALGIIKTEAKDDYIDILEEPDALQAIERAGIPLNKIQKGALVINIDKRVYSIDSLNHKTKYWLDDFLKVVPADSPESRARAGGLVLKSVANCLTDTSARLDLSRKLVTAIEESESVTVADLRELSEVYLNPGSVSDIFAGVRDRYGLALEDKIEIDSRSLQRYARDLTRRIPVGEGVSILVASQNTEVAGIQVSKTRSGFRVVAEFSVGEEE